MTTVKVKFRASSIQNREGTLFIQLIHNRVVRAMTINVKLFHYEWDDGGQRIIIDTSNFERAVHLYLAQKTLGAELQRLQAIIEKFEKYRSYKTADVVEAFTGKSSKSGFFPFMLKRIEQLEEAGQERTAQTYKITYRMFLFFIGDSNLKFEQIDDVLLSNFEDILLARGITKNTSSFYMRILKSVYNRSVVKGLTEDKKPFKSVYTGVEKTKKRAVDRHVIAKLKDFKSSDVRLLFARDMFLFSFYARGMSFVDVFHLKKENIVDNVLTYKRSKTRQLLSIRVEVCMWNIIKQYAAQVRRSVYLFPFILNSKKSLYNQYCNALRIQNNRLQAISEQLNLKMTLTSYVSRHTWASLARSKGIALSVISEGMGHTSEATTQIYLASFDQSVIDKANLTVISD